MADTAGASAADIVLQCGIRAKNAARQMAAASPAAKERALLSLAELLISHERHIMDANQEDVDKARAAGLDSARLDRLRLTPAIIAEMTKSCRDIAAQPDPIGALDSQWQRPNGLLVGKMRVPIGVVAMIFESRPNVTVDSAILCLKAGNAVILRGGSEALQSNLFLMGLVRRALSGAGLPEDAGQLIPVTDRSAVAELCKLDAHVDVMIPRGGESLIRTVSSLAAMPVLKHDKGVCHAYFDQDADRDMAVPVIVNAKANRPSTCNALECLLVHGQEAAALLPLLGRALLKAGVEIRACRRSLPILEQHGVTATAAADDDYGMEFLALILAVKIVDSLDGALDHIARHGSRHTEVIFSRDHSRISRFLREVDASMVAVNASTRLNDGGQLGLGAEIGISTSKLHAYGPMGIHELTTTKFVVMGSGQVRQ